MSACIIIPSSIISQLLEQPTDHPPPTRTHDRTPNDTNQVECFTDDAAALPDAFFAQFDVVVVSGLPPAQLVSLGVGAFHHRRVSIIDVHVHMHTHHPCVCDAPPLLSFQPHHPTHRTHSSASTPPAGRKGGR